MASTDGQKDDEIVTITLSRRHEERLRKMIERDEALSVSGAYFRNVLLVAVGGILTMIAFWEQIKKIILNVVGGGS